MQIQSSGRAVSRCVATVTRRARRDTMRPEVGYCQKVPRGARLEKLKEEQRSGTRRRNPERAETREGFELERAISCGSRDHRWRTKLDFSSSESLNDLHRSAAFRAAPKPGRVFGGGRVLFGLRFLCGTEQLKAKRQESGTLAVGQKAEVTDAHESFGEQVQQEAAQELVDRQGQQLLLVVVSGIAPAKSDLAIGKGDQAMVGDSHAVGVATQILQHIFGATEGTLQVHHPVLSVERPITVVVPMGRRNTQLDPPCIENQG